MRNLLMLMAEVDRQCGLSNVEAIDMLTWITPHPTAIDETHTFTPGTMTQTYDVLLIFGAIILETVQ